MNSISELERRISALEQKLRIVPPVLPSFMDSYPETVRKKILSLVGPFEDALEFTDHNFFDAETCEKIKKNLNLKELYKIGSLYTTDVLSVGVSNEGVIGFYHTDEAGEFHFLPDAESLLQFGKDGLNVPALNPMELSWLE